MIEVKNITKIFNGITVLNNISVNIQKGEKVVVVGPSGSGKSTFLRCLNLLETPETGEVYFEGQQINKEGVDINAVRRKMEWYSEFQSVSHLRY